MLSQFTKEGNHATLGELYEFPNDVYPIGSLDTDSEGLIVITNDKRLKNKVLDPLLKIENVYLSQVEGALSEVTLSTLKNGIEISLNGKINKVIPSKVIEVINPEIPERNPPIRFRQNVPTSWLQMSMIETKNKQIRKITAAVGNPTLRLIKTQIGKLVMKGMQPGDIVEYTEPNIYKLIGVSHKK